MQLGGTILKLSPLINVTTSACVFEAWHINSAHAPLNRVVSLMTFMDRQWSLTTRFVSIVSLMNIHGSTNRTSRDT